MNVNSEGEIGTTKVDEKKIEQAQMMVKAVETGLRAVNNGLRQLERRVIILERKYGIKHSPDSNRRPW